MQFRNYGRRRNSPAKVPWSSPLTQSTSPRSQLPILTTYMFKNNLYADLAAILRQIPTEGEITIQPGKHDVTKWKRIKDLFGNSMVYTATGYCSLQEWNKPTTPEKINILALSQLRTLGGSLKSLRELDRQ